MHAVLLAEIDNVVNKNLFFIKLVSSLYNYTYVYVNLFYAKCKFH